MIKTLAEWSKQELLMLALPHEKTDWKPYLDEILQGYKDFIKAVSAYQKVLLIAPNEADFKPFKDFQNVEFFQCDTNDTWIRDYGAIDICENERLMSLDFSFNAWGNKFQSQLDNEVNSKLFKQHFKSELRTIDLILEGGSIDFNGQGVMLTTKTCLLNENRNSHLNQGELEAKLKQIFNLKTIIWLENGFIKGDDTDSHIDTLARFIDEETIAHCICEDEEDEHFLPLLKMKEELQKTGFKLVELPLPKPLYYEGRRLGASYANFVFINEALILPSYADEKDELIKERLQKALPQRKIISLDARVFLRQNGSLHCACQNRFLGQR
ncbi:agamatine deiminase [Campylobacter sp. MIT 12-5580]|uniref:agmatine deiminase family protein n=1 Tax=Campylobacter sp. MIT 12-5580 TaxID=2040651 RepID=UPI0010F71F2A|nr:agmatine deiminase family protein [Campylobacter sp. MIT 12-5580]TKX28726.1 agamatine deiminase [Campylobacter sp. MIT 12-5580]